MSGQYYLNGPDGRWPELLAGAVSRFEFEAGINRTARAQLTIRNDGLTWQDNELLADGQEMAVQFGTTTRTIRRRMRIHQVRGTSALTVPAYGAGADLSDGDRWRLWENASAGEVAAVIARTRGLESDVQFEGLVRHQQIAQAGESDGRLLVRLATAIGWEFWVDDRTVHFRPPDYAARPVALLERGQNLDLFDPQEQTLAMPGEVLLRTFDLRTKSYAELLIHEGIATRTVLGQGALRSPTAGRLTAWTATQDQAAYALEARGLYEHLERATVAVKFRCAGNPNLMPGAIVQIAGHGSRWDGLYRIALARHQFNQNAYLVDGYLQRNAAGQIGSVPKGSSPINQQQADRGRPFATVTTIDLATGQTRKEEIR